jgi:hypothetical protein
VTDELSWSRGTPVSEFGDRSIFEGLSGESDPSGARSGGFRQVRACQHKGTPWSGGYGAEHLDRSGRLGSGHRQTELAFRQDCGPRLVARTERP